jgi:methyl-accepting chemotaxis protein
MIMHPVKPEMEGQNYADLKDSTGKRFFAEFLDLVKSKGSG